MAPRQLPSTGEVQQAIHTDRDRHGTAVKQRVLTTLAAQCECSETEARDAFTLTQRIGEIYSFDRDGECVVKITSEVMQ